MRPVPADLGCALSYVSYMAGSLLLTMRPLLWTVPTRGALAEGPLCHVPLILFLLGPGRMVFAWLRQKCRKAGGTCKLSGQALSLSLIPLL